MSDAFCTELVARLREVFARMHAGDDVPPAVLFRTEGFAEAGLVSGAISAVQLTGILARLCDEVLGRDFTEVFGVDAEAWILDDSRLRLEPRKSRAPVYPG